MKLRTSMVGVLAVLALVSAACGGPESEGAAASDPGTAEETPANGQDAPDGEEPAEPVAPAGDGGCPVVREEGEAIDDYIDRLYMAALEEGEVRYYSSSNEKELVAVEEGFNEFFPDIEFVTVTGQTSTLLQRALVEARSGQPGDFYKGSSADMAALAEGGVLVEYRPANEEFVNPDYIFENAPYFGTSFLTLHIAYNTELVNEEDLPTTWEGFLDPEWAGGKLAVDQGAYEFTAGIIQSMGEEEGEAFLRELAAQEPRLVAGSTLRTELLAAGEFPVMLDGYGHRLLEFVEGGAPIEVLVPHPDPLIAVTSLGGVMADAPHPCAARLMAEFLLTPEGQEVFIAQNKPSVLSEGVEAPYPQFMEGAEVVALDPAQVDFEAAANLFNDLFVR